MANLTISTNDLGGVIVDSPIFREGLMQFPGADTYAEGTIIARRAIASIITMGDAVGTGNGTVTLAAPVAGPIVPMVGAYSLVCTVAATHGGTFKLLDPNGMEVADDLLLTEGAGVDTTFVVAGMTFVITDGSTDFAVADTFALTPVADGDFVIFAEAGIGGAQNPIGVLSYEIIAAAEADVSCSVMVGGTTRKDKLIIDADGDDSNVTEAILDRLRSAGIDAVTVTELLVRDNS